MRTEELKHKQYKLSFRKRNVQRTVIKVWDYSAIVSVYLGKSWRLDVEISVLLICSKQPSASVWAEVNQCTCPSSSWVSCQETKESVKQWKQAACFGERERGWKETLKVFTRAKKIKSQRLEFKTFLCPSSQKPQTNKKFDRRTSRHDKYQFSLEKKGQPSTTMWQCKLSFPATTYCFGNS